MSSVQSSRAAVPSAGLHLVTMGVADLDVVLRLEQAAYAFPWTRGNMIDSLAAGYLAELLRDADQRLIGYFIAMPGVEEMHLLNITVEPALQGRGHARYMLDRLVQRCRVRGAHKLWLEVRVSNQRARALYERYGFSEVGLRKRYYPADGGREDAVVMSLPTKEHGDGAD